VYGGACKENDLYISPTIIEQVKWEDPIMQEEIMGPVLPILTFDRLPDLLRELATKQHPLCAYFFTRDQSAEKAFINSLPYGCGCINDCISQYNPWLPFGGIGASGTGKYGGKYSFETFSHRKAVLSRPYYSYDWPFPYPGKGSAFFKLYHWLLGF